MSSNAEQLANHVRAQRMRLGLKQEDLALIGGPSDTTVSQIENHKLETISLSTLKKLDASLQWESGSASRIWHDGGEPVVTPRDAVSVGVSDEDEDTLLYRRPAGITDEKWRQLRARTRNLVEWEIEQALRDNDRPE